MALNFIDGMIILLLVMGSLKGYRQGLLGSLVNLFGSLGGLILAIKSYQPVSLYVDQKLGAVNRLVAFLGDKIPLPAQVAALPVAENGLKILEITINEMAMPRLLKEQMVEKAYSMVQLAGEMGITTIGDLLVYIIAVNLVSLIVFLLLWLLLQNVFLLIARFLTNTFDSTIIGGFNRLAGVLVGGGLSVLGLMITLGVINFVLGLTRGSQPAWLIALEDKINYSLLVPYFQAGSEAILAKILSFI